MKKKSSKAKFHVIFVSDSMTSIKHFKTKTAAEKFIKEFKVNTDIGDWVDYLIEGKLTEFE